MYLLKEIEFKVKRKPSLSAHATSPVSSGDNQLNVELEHSKDEKIFANSMARIFIKMFEQENLIPYKLESGALEI